MKTILKYAGNKHRIMPSIVTNFGNMANVKRYFEPFCGSLGSALNSNISKEIEMFLSDINVEIIELYEEIKKSPINLENLVNSFPSDETGYYEIRNWDRHPNWPENKTQIERAARTLYLNKRGFNGLYRKNKKGFFTASWNKNLNPQKIDVLNHSDFINFINQNNIKISCLGWEDAIKNCGKNDLIYADPPYVDLKDHKKSFSGYVGNFEWEEQIRLRNTLIELSKKGAHVVVSNSWCEQTIELYKDWNISEIKAPRLMSSKSSSRGSISELVAWI